MAARSSWKLGVGVALLLGLPLAGFAFKTIHTLLFSDDGPRAVMEISSPKRLERPVPGSFPASSLDLVRGEREPEPQPVAQTAVPIASPPEAPTQAQAEKRSYPKLKPTTGWRSWFQTKGPKYAFYEQPQQQATPAPAPAEPPVAAGPAATPSPKPPDTLPAKSRAKAGYKPPPVSYTALPNGTQTGPGGPVGELVQAQASSPAPSNPARRGKPDTTFIGPPDKLPQPNPEHPLPDGTCPKRGWWKSPYTGLCYAAKASCDASDYAHQGCAQPNP